MSDYHELLKCFDASQIVESACRQVFGQSRHFAVPGMCKDAVAKGYLEAIDGDGDIIDNVRTYGRDLILTDKGREFCGLPKVNVKPKAAAKTLFD